MKANSQDNIQDVRHMLNDVGISDTKYITTQSMKRGGAQLYQKLPVKLKSIMKKGKWTDHKAMQRYLEFHNRNQDTQFESALALDHHHTVKRCRFQDQILYEIAQILGRSAAHLTGEQLRSQLLHAMRRPRS